jgi:hypothetical protein
VEELDPAVLVEDRQEGKEHREFDQAWTSCQFEIVTCPGCMGAGQEPGVKPVDKDPFLEVIVLRWNHLSTGKSGCGIQCFGDTPAPLKEFILHAFADENNADQLGWGGVDFR